MDTADRISHPTPAQSTIGTARFQQGMTLVELMVSITIGLLLVAGITLLISQQSSSSNELDKASRQIENGRYAMQLLQQEIQLAGYYGEFSSLPAPPAALPSPCATTVSAIQPALPLFVQGYDSPALGLTSCLANADHVPGTDILVIRHADTTPIPLASAAAGQVYIQATQAAYVMGTGSDTSVFTLKKKDNTTLADLRKFMVTIFYVSPCNVKSGDACSSTSDNGRPIPTLKRLDLSVNSSGTATFVETPLVEGIENLQIDYGIDNDGDGAPDSYNKSPALTDWPNVMTARISLVARNNDPSTGHTDTKTYQLGDEGSVGPFSDGYKRHAFTQVVRFINPSGRREQ